MKIQVLSVENNNLGSLLTMDFFKVSFNKINAFGPKLSSFKFLPAIGILASAWGLKGASKFQILT